MVENNNIADQLLVSRGGERWPVNRLREQHFHTRPLIVWETLEARPASLGEPTTVDDHKHKHNHTREDESSNMMDM